MAKKGGSATSNVVVDVGSVEANNVVICSICLDVVEESSSRSSVTLHCTHKFHLDCLGSFFNFKRCMECPNCREPEIGKWVCSRNYAPSGDGDALEGVDLPNLNITVTPLASVWDSLEEVPQLQPSSDSSSGTLPVDTALAEGVLAELGLPTPAAISPHSAPLLFSLETDDLHIEANVLERYRELYPALYTTVMTIQRVSAYVGRGSDGQERTDESIWAEPSLPSEAGDTDELTDEQAIPSFPPAAGSRPPPK